MRLNNHITIPACVCGESFLADTLLTPPLLTRYCSYLCVTTITGGHTGGMKHRHILGRPIHLQPPGLFKTKQKLASASTSSQHTLQPLCLLLITKAKKRSPLTLLPARAPRRASWPLLTQFCALHHGGESSNYACACLGAEPCCSQQQRPGRGRLLGVPRWVHPFQPARAALRVSKEGPFEVPCALAATVSGEEVRVWRWHPSCL